MQEISSSLWKVGASCVFAGALTGCATSGGVALQSQVPPSSGVGQTETKSPEHPYSFNELKSYLEKLSPISVAFDPQTFHFALGDGTVHPAADTRYEVATLDKTLSSIGLADIPSEDITQKVVIRLGDEVVSQRMADEPVVIKVAYSDERRTRQVAMSRYHRVAWQGHSTHTHHREIAYTHGTRVARAKIQAPVRLARYERRHTTHFASSRSEWSLQASSR